MSDTNIEQEILDKTQNIIACFNKYFLRELAVAVSSDYIRDDGAEYYERVIKDMYRHAYLRLRIAPNIGTPIYFYENADGELWKHTIPGRLTKTGKKSIISAACRWNAEDYILDRFDFPYSY